MKTIKSNQSEVKNTLTEIKNNLQQANSGINEAENQIPAICNIRKQKTPNQNSKKNPKKLRIV